MANDTVQWQESPCGKATSAIFELSCLFGGGHIVGIRKPGIWFADRNLGLIKFQAALPKVASMILTVRKLTGRRGNHIPLGARKGLGSSTGLSLVYSHADVVSPTEANFSFVPDVVPHTGAITASLSSCSVHTSPRAAGAILSFCPPPPPEPEPYTTGQTQ